MNCALRESYENLESEIATHLLRHQDRIENWFVEQWRSISPVFYCSVDLRNAGYKLAPVDTNLFPAGFNNISEDCLPNCVYAIRKTLQDAYPSCNKILLIPENHTRNLYYLENVVTLQNILLQAGFEAKVGSLLLDLEKPHQFDLPSGRKLLIEPVLRRGNQIELKHYTPDVILLNNDLSGEVPDILQDIIQPIDPLLTLGWNTRLKSTHFAYYELVSQWLADLIKMDSWLINPYSKAFHQVDFTNNTGYEDLAEAVGLLFTTIKQKYVEYRIKHNPFVVIKSDNGTYGMNVMMVNHAEDIFKLNRKNRARMSVSKGGQSVDKFIIQEGIYTIETSQQQQAETVIYMVGQHMVGGFQRIHPERANNENLNSPGMYFESLQASHYLKKSAQSFIPTNFNEKFYSCSVIARLAALASAYEKQEAFTVKKA